jgi:hypothetical protein
LSQEKGVFDMIESHVRTEDLDSAKIKCNRLRPSCEACQVFNCDCVYGRELNISDLELHEADLFWHIDAVPKKRGPKTDVLEALLKRVNGLEKRLKDEGKDPDEGIQEAIVAESVRDAVDKKPSKKAPTPPDALAPPPVEAQQVQQPRPQPPQRHPSIGFPDQFVRWAPIVTAFWSENMLRVFISQQAPAALQNNTLLDAYFTRIHSKPYYILDEAATRQRWQTGQLPPSVINAIHAVTARCVS